MQAKRRRVGVDCTRTRTRQNAKSDEAKGRTRARVKSKETREEINVNAFHWSFQSSSLLVVKEGELKGKEDEVFKARVQNRSSVLFLNQSKESVVDCFFFNNVNGGAKSHRLTNRKDAKHAFENVLHHCF
jgi:hypothetical protein